MRLNAFLPRGRIVLGVAALLLLHLPAWADTPDERASLKGLGAVMVMVGMFGPEAEEYGLMRRHLQTDVELRLRQSGIQVSNDASAWLTVNVSTWKIEAGTYAVNILLRLNQMVGLDRNLHIRTLGTTWETDSLLVVGAGPFRIPDARSKVADLVDQFINAYLEQNPKR